MEQTISNIDIHNIKCADLNEICRLCLKKCDDMVLVPETKITDMLLDCALVQFPVDEEYLNYACIQCINEVNMWYEFKKNVLRSIEICKQIKEKQSTEDVLPSTILIVQSDDNSLNNYSNDEFGENTEIIKIHVTNLDEVDSHDNEDNSGKVLKQHVRCHEDTTLYECSKCSKSFKTVHLLKEHENRHYDLRRFACEVCGKRFYKKFNILEHMRMHTGERPFQCNFCERTFIRKIHMRNHVQKEHTNDQPYICEFCSKGFMDGWSLKVHLRQHTGEKPFPCFDCDKRFTTSSQLKTHVKSQHVKSKEFMCDICGKAFTVKFGLQEHLSVHRGEKKQPTHRCLICDKMYTTKTLLQKHIRSKHTDERPFKCDQCDKSFLTNEYLVVHKRTHTDERPFECTTCLKRFRTKYVMQKHMKTH